MFRLICVVWHAVLGTCIEFSHFPDEGRSQQGEYIDGWAVQQAKVPAVDMGIGNHFPSSVLDACFTGCSSSEFLGIGGCCEKEEWGWHTFSL